MTEHSPLPWIKDDEGIWTEYDADSEMIMIFGPEGVGFGRVAHVYAECGGEVNANAEFIVRACNSHADLLRALEILFKQINNDHAYKDTFAMQQAKQAIIDAKE